MVQSGCEPPSKQPRSFKGCVRCKRRRQKCDEIKPQCGRCNEARVSCEYLVKLRWGGRDFRHSRFGNCMEGIRRTGAEETSHDSRSFVYASVANSVARGQRSGLTLPPDLEILPQLSAAEKGLLFHFTDEASRVTCCGPHVQKELCHLIIPMAVSSPSLMHATLAWSAIQSFSSKGYIRSVTNPDQFIAGLKAKSIEHLRRELRDPKLGQDEGSSDAVLATVRTLCQCEIHSGSDAGSSWRAHVKGAKALMATIESRRMSSTRPKNRMLYRWYDALDSLATLAYWGNTASEDMNMLPPVDQLGDKNIYLDDYNGYSTDLSQILGKIGTVVGSLNRRSPLPEDNEIQDIASSLESSVRHIMDRDNASRPLFYPGVAQNLTNQAIQEYCLCNQAYQHTALIHIFRRLQKLPRADLQVQNSVKRIIECVQGISPAIGLSPAIVLTTPLFTAGCEAIGKDRDIIRDLLRVSYDMLRIRNIQVTLDVLESFWACSEREDSWKVVLQQKNWDFIPY